MKKTILFVMLFGVVALQCFGKPKYRIVVKQIEGTLKYIPQVKKEVPDFIVKHWVSISNQPLSSENEARNYVMESQIIDKQIQQSTIINYIYIK